MSFFYGSFLYCKLSNSQNGWTLFYCSRTAPCILGWIYTCLFIHTKKLQISGWWWWLVFYSNFCTCGRLKVIWFLHQEPYWHFMFSCWSEVSSSGLAAKHIALYAKGHRFNPIKRPKLFQGLISWLTTLSVADHIKCHCRIHWTD